MIEKNKIMILCSICTLIFVSGGKGGFRACHMHLCQLRSPRGGRLDGFYFCLSFRRVYFWARKSQEKLRTQIRASPVQDSCHVCVKVASSLTFCAHSSLQSFSTSDKMKGPKTGPPGGTTFDPKRVHFGSLLKYICFAQGSKTGPSAFWIWCLPGGLFDAPFKYSLEARCWNQATNIRVTHHSNYELATRASNKGGPDRVSKKSGDFRF